MDAWRAPVARTMEMLSFLRGYDVPEDGLGPQYAGYETASPHYNRVVHNKAAAILLCRNLYPNMEGEDERYQLARERCLETADLLEKNSD